MKVVTTEEMREIDRRAIEDFGVPSLKLMESAGRGVARAIRRRVTVEQADVIVVCGTGNNGGDGFVIARRLSEAGANVLWADLALNPLNRLREDLGGRVCFQTLTDVQFVLRSDNPAAVGQHARNLIAALGSFDGGLIACHEVAEDQPWENIEAVLRMFREDGRYPLRWTWDGARAVPRDPRHGTDDQGAAECPRKAGN